MTKLAIISSVTNLLLHPEAAGFGLFMAFDIFRQARVGGTIADGVIPTR